MMVRDYAVSGLRLRSEVELSAEPANFADADVTVVTGACSDIPWRRPSSHVIAESFDHQGWPRYSFCALDDGATVARFYSLAEFTLREDLREVVCHRHPEVPSDMAGLLISGSIAAYLLTSAGNFVLHASAVELDPGHAVAFVGPTTKGKTTCAALLCAEGCGLVTDDVLVVSPSPGPPRCRRGAATLRLRPQQAGLVSRFGITPDVTSTPDDRLAVRPARLAPDDLELGAIVVPNPSREESSIRVSRLTPTETVGVLLRMTRIEGWRRIDNLTQLFWQATRLANAIPALEVTIPWGPPFAPDLGVELADHLSRALSAAHE